MTFAMTFFLIFQRKNWWIPHVGFSNKCKFCVCVSFSLLCFCFLFVFLFWFCCSVCNSRCWCTFLLHLCLSTVNFSVLTMHPLLTDYYASLFNTVKLALLHSLGRAVFAKKLYLHLLLDHGGHWGTTDIVTTSFLHFSLFFSALWD